MPKNSSATKKGRAVKGAKKKGAAKSLHVVPRAGRWVVRSEGSSRANSVHDTQRAAVEAARILARKAAVSLVIHGRDGRVKSRDSYRPDPPPPMTPREVLFPTSTPLTTTREAITRAVSEAISEATAKVFGEGGGGSADEGEGAGESRRSSRSASRR